MHLEETYTGIMRIASNRDGKPYKDWRGYYVDQSGLIMIFQSDSRPDKYAVYFFMPRGMYMHSSLGELQVDDGKIKIETKNSIYEFDIDPTCVPKEVLPTLIANAQIYFDSNMETNVAGQ